MSSLISTSIGDGDDLTIDRYDRNPVCKAAIRSGIVYESKTDKLTRGACSPRRKVACQRRGAGSQTPLLRSCKPDHTSAAESVLLITSTGLAVVLSKCWVGRIPCGIHLNTRSQSTGAIAVQRIATIAPKMPPYRFCDIINAEQRDC